MANYVGTVHIIKFNVGRLLDTPNTAKCLLLVSNATHNNWATKAGWKQHLCSLRCHPLLECRLRNDPLHQSSCKGEIVHVDEGNDATRVIAIEFTGYGPRQSYDMLAGLGEQRHPQYLQQPLNEQLFRPRYRLIGESKATWQLCRSQLWDRKKISLECDEP